MTSAFHRWSALLLMAATLGLSGCGYNQFQSGNEQVKASWSEVLSQYQRRADLIPNLVNVVKGQANFEQSTLPAVVEARSKATSIQASPELVNDPQAFQKFQQAQKELSGSLSRLLVSVEAYPQLKSQEGFLKLQDQLEGSENRIRITIRDYNEAVRQYNTTIRTFPDIIGAKVIHGAKEMTPYKAVTEGAEAAPVLDMAPKQ